MSQDDASQDDASQDDTNQAMRTLPEQAEAGETPQGVADDSFDDTPEQRRRAEHPANKERGGTIAGGGSRDE